MHLYCTCLVCVFAVPADEVTGEPVVPTPLVAEIVSGSHEDVRSEVEGAGETEYQTNPDTSELLKAPDSMETSESPEQRSSSKPKSLEEQFRSLYEPVDLFDEGPITSEMESESEAGEASKPLNLSMLNALAPPRGVPATRDLSLTDLGEPATLRDDDGLAIPYKQPWEDNLRQTLDLAARPIYNARTGDWRHISFIGIDLHKVFSDEDQDIGTLTFQAYLTRFDDFQRFPPFADDPHDWEIVYRILNFNYTALSRGGFNIRVGHMEIPYGLEQIINTNGTLLDYLHNRNIGV